MAPNLTPEEIKLLELAARHAIAEEPASSNPIPGKLSARERLDLLLDEGTFEEIGKFVTHRATDFDMASRHPPGDGIVTGYGRIHGRIVCVFAQDATVFDGSLSEANATKVVTLIDAAIRIGAPLIGLYDSSGARLQEGIAAIAASTDVLFHLTLASGIVPQIAAILGPCADIAALAPALADFTLASTGDDSQCLASVRELLAFLPANRKETPPHQPACDTPSRADTALDTHIPISNQPCDMREIITRIVDRDASGKGYLFQIQEHFAPNMLTGFARMNGRTIGLVANQPIFLNGILNGDACAKAAHFVRSCNAFNIPLVTFVNTPGMHPDQDSIRHAAQLLRAFAEATVPRLTVILRKTSGAAYGIMGSRHLRADLNFAWPTAEIVAAEPETAISILYRNELESLVRRVQAAMPQGVTLSEEQKLEILTEAREEKVEAYRERFANPYIAAERGYIDAVIRPSETRHRLNTALDMLATRHGNILP